MLSNLVPILVTLKFVWFQLTSTRWKVCIDLLLTMLHAEAGCIWIKIEILLLRLIMIFLLHVENLPLRNWLAASLHAKSSIAYPPLRLERGPDGLRNTSGRQVSSLIRGRFCLFEWGCCQLKNLRTVTNWTLNSFISVSIFDFLLLVIFFHSTIHCSLTRFHYSILYKHKLQMFSPIISHLKTVSPFFWNRLHVHK